MGSRSRKLYIWLVSLGAVLTIFLLYSLLSKTPLTDVESQDQLKEDIADSNFGWTDGEVGSIGGVGVEGLKGATFLHRNQNKEIDREFGFEELLHEEKDEWEIRKPFMNVYQNSLDCFVTADRGTVQVESAVGRPTPGDAKFTGNVLIHILPKPSSEFKESFIYLDDIVFISEKSLFSTAGPVKFVSQDAWMLGRGLQVIYNSELGRLEFLKLVQLDSLHIKRMQPIQKERKAQKTTAQTSPLSSTQSPPGEAGKTTETAKKEPSEPGQYYRCLFSKNVVIETPEQVVWARDELFINDVFWAENEKSAGKQASEAKPPDTEKDIKNVNKADVTVAKEDKPKGVSQQSDIVLTCDGGVVVAPANSIQVFDVSVGDVNRSAPDKLDDSRGRATFAARKIDYDATTGNAVAVGASRFTFFAGSVTASDVNVAVDANEAPAPVVITAQKQTSFLQDSNQVIFEGDCLCTMPQQVGGRQRDSTLSSPMFTVNLPEGKTKQSFALTDISAAGPAELIFYVDDLTGSAPGRPAFPAKVTAQEEIRFISRTKQVIFEGDCLCSLLREEKDIRQEYMLSAPRLTIDLPKDTNDSYAELATDIKHLTADGGSVRLATVTTSGEQLLSGVELKCHRFDYDPNQRLSKAMGPGIIKFNNSKAADTKDKLSGFSLRKPCWAIVEDFDSLQYFAEPNRIIADAGSDKLLINYFPVVNGKLGKQVEARAGFVEAFLDQSVEGQTELATLTATNGITFEDEDNQFIGSRLFYDHKKALMTIQGDVYQPCYLNGALVDNIEYDLETGKRKAKVVGPGALQLK